MRKEGKKPGVLRRRVTSYPLLSEASGTTSPTRALTIFSLIAMGWLGNRLGLRGHTLTVCLVCIYKRNGDGDDTRVMRWSESPSVYDA